ncbi:MAG: LysM peptidoglycan-binding domain-containing protein, partial [Nevskia sp.]|nr:LysM peptidoglycan-binding domain-containing protein [Nevskia sp.]
APVDPLDGMPLPNLPALPAATPADDGAGAAPPAGAAQTELKLAQERTGLSDAQLAQLNDARARLAAGDAGTALASLQALNAQLRSEARSYTVRDGESLRQIAARPEVYDNARLWPLLWKANKDHIKQPAHLEPGTILTVPAHPTVREVEQAIAHARKNATAGTPATPHKSTP